MSLFHLLGLKLLAQKVNYVPYLENLEKFPLDLFIPRYSNSPKVSCFGMNPGSRWNPDLEESNLPEYSEYEAKNFTQGTSGIYIWPVNVSAPEPSPISRYRKCTKMTSFSSLEFSSMKPRSSIAVAVALFRLHNDLFEGGSDTMLSFNGYIRY